MFVAILAVALTQTPDARVVLHVTGTEPACPDEAWLRRNVTARLGYSPFVVDAPLTATAKVECTAQACQAKLELVAAEAPPRRRTLTAPASQCAELMESLGLALALALDPQLLSRPEPVAPLPPPPPPPEPSQPAPAPPPPAPVVVHFQGSLVGHGSFGLSPYPTGGGAIALGFRVGWFSLSAEGRADVPRSVAVEGGEVSSDVLLGSLLPCGHVKGFGLCLMASAGALQVAGSIPLGQRETGPLLLVGGRLEYEWMFSRFVGLHAQLTVEGVVTRSTVVVARDVAVWVTSPVAADAGLGIVVLF